MLPYLVFCITVNIAICRFSKSPFSQTVYFPLLSKSLHPKLYYLEDSTVLVGLDKLLVWEKLIWKQRGLKEEGTGDEDERRGATGYINCLLVVKQSVILTLEVKKWWMLPCWPRTLHAFKCSISSGSQIACTFDRGKGSPDLHLENRLSLQPLRDTSAFPLSFRHYPACPCNILMTTLPRGWSSSPCKTQPKSTACLKSEQAILAAAVCCFAQHWRDNP